MAAILVFGEFAQGAVRAISFEAVTLGRRLAAAGGLEIHGALVGPEGVMAAAGRFDCGFASLTVIEDACFGHYLAGHHVAAARALIGQLQPSIVVLPHTAQSRDWAAQLAVELGAALVLDCVDATLDSGKLSVAKPMHGGAVLGTLEVAGEPALLTVRGGVLEGAPLAGALGTIRKLDMPLPGGDGPVSHLETVQLESGEGPKLKDAKVIVSGGRGTGGRENWHLVEDAAAAIGGAVGCSRAIVDMGWLKWNHQVGLSGTIVAPDLYVAVGISGAVQHLAGISNARTVVAINNDPEAEIFGRADYGVVGNCVEVLPAFTARVRELRDKG